LEVHRGLDGRYYVIDTSRLFPPERPQRAKLDRNIRSSHLYCLLRPEFVKSYPKPLSRYAHELVRCVCVSLNLCICSDGFSVMGDHGNAEHNAELTEATNYLKEKYALAARMCYLPRA
jgi:hypothetical protein